jgi:Tfp pilus assembly protein PilF
MRRLFVRRSLIAFYGAAITGAVFLTTSFATAGERQVVDVYLDRGLDAEKRFDLDAALRNYNAAIEQFPKNPVAYYNRGGFYLRRGKCQLAIQDYSTALTIRPSFWWAANARAALYGATGRYDLALADYEKVLSLHPGGDIRATVLNNRARIYATCPDPKFRDGRRAVSDAKEACTYSHWNATYTGTLAAAYAELGDFDNAIKYQKRAMARVTGDDTLREPQTRLAEYQRHQPYRERPICPGGKDGTIETADHGKP